MNNNSIIKKEEGDLFYIVSGIYLIVVGLSGGALNIFALVRAIRVSL